MVRSLIALALGTFMFGLSTYGQEPVTTEQRASTGTIGVLRKIDLGDKLQPVYSTLTDDLIQISVADPADPDKSINGFTIDLDEQGTLEQVGIVRIMPPSEPEPPFEGAEDSDRSRIIIRSYICAFLIPKKPGVSMVKVVIDRGIDGQSKQEEFKLRIHVESNIPE